MFWIKYFIEERLDKKLYLWYNHEMILRYLRLGLVLVLLMGGTLLAQSDELQSWSDSQLGQFLKLDQSELEIKTQLLRDAQTRGNTEAESRYKTELEGINSRLQAYNQEIRRRSQLPTLPEGATGTTHGGTVSTTTKETSTNQQIDNTYRVDENGNVIRTQTTDSEYYDGFTGETVKTNSKTESIAGSRPATEYVQAEELVYENGVPVKYGTGYESGTENEGGYVTPTSALKYSGSSSVKINPDGSSVSESEWSSTHIQKTQNWVDLGTGNNMPDGSGPQGSTAGGFFDQYQPKGTAQNEAGQGAAPSEDDGEGRKEGEDGRDKSAEIKGVDTEAAEEKDCEGQTVFCGIGLEEGGKLTGEKLGEVNKGKGAGITTNTNLKRLVIGWVRYLLTFIVIVAVIAIIYAGVMMILHFGDDGQLEKSKKIIIWCVVGLVVVFLAFAIVNVIVRAVDPGDGEGGTKPGERGASLYKQESSYYIT